jgi:hypothetical protein
MGQILDQYGKPVKKDESVWMSFEEHQAHEQFMLRGIARMFPTLQGFLWDVEPKQPSNE